MSKSVNMSNKNISKIAASCYKINAVSGIILRPFRSRDPADLPPEIYIQAQKLYMSNQKKMSETKMLPSVSTRTKKVI